MEQEGQTRAEARKKNKGGAEAIATWGPRGTEGFRGASPSGVPDAFL